MIKPWFQLPTELEILCHIPFYLNMISGGYLLYWTFKLDLIDYPYLEDVTGFIYFAKLAYIISGIVMFAVMIDSFREKKRHWRWEILYVALNIFFVFAWLLNCLSHMNLGPSS